MGIFAQEVRLVGAVTVSPDHPRYIRIHVGIHIGIVAVALIVDRPGRIHGVGQLVEGIEVLSPAALVAERPEDDARMVPVPLDDPCDPVLECGEPGSLLAEGVVAVALYVGLIHHIHPIIVI